MLPDIIDEVGGCRGERGAGATSDVKDIKLRSTSNQNDFGTKRYLIFGAKKASSAVDYDYSTTSPFSLWDVPATRPNSPSKFRRVVPIGLNDTTTG
jgi:hypothetical protein